MLHFNYYAIVICIFTLGGIATTVWGWLILAKGKRMQGWPHVEGIIEKSKHGMENNDLLPEIVFSYTVDGKHYTCVQEFPASLEPTKEFTDSYVNKYPIGAKVDIKYNPSFPGRATLEGSLRDDWMVFWWGIAMVVIGIVALIAGG
jgi:hypothetical protein